MKTNIYISLRNQILLFRDRLYWLLWSIFLNEKIRKHAPLFRFILKLLLRNYDIN